MPRLAIMNPNKTGTQAEGLEHQLRRSIVGQDQAILEIVRAYQTHLAGLSPIGRPVANFLFLGPTGSGKTRIVEAVAECLLNTPRAITKIDCAEFQHSHEIAKLIGSPPGYLGHRETHALLSQEALNQHHTDKTKLSFVLFDEIEKASDSLWNLLLGILDKGTLTLGDNRKVDFSASMIFMTSNLGAAEMSSLLSPRMGFQAPRQQVPASDTKLGGRISDCGIAAARRKFTPEFINRLDSMVVFKSLGEQELCKILDLELQTVCERIHAAASNKPFILNVADSARGHLLREGTDLRYGARHLKRAIERLLVQPLSNLMASDQVRRGDRVHATYAEGSALLTFSREARGIDALECAGRVAA